MFGVVVLQDIHEAHAGQIVAVFGVDCASGSISSIIHFVLHELCFVSASFQLNPFFLITIHQVIHLQTGLLGTP